MDNENIIMGKFIYGIKEIPYNTLTIIKNDTTNKKLQFLFKVKDNISQIEINSDEINDINIRQNVIMNSSKPNSLSEVDKEIAAQLLGNAMWGPMGMILGGQIGEAMAGYEKINYNNVWEVTITYNDKKLLISFNIDPTNFIQKINH